VRTAFFLAIVTLYKSYWVQTLIHLEITNPRKSR
jgi:hypothetical protein